MRIEKGLIQAQFGQHAVKKSGGFFLGGGNGFGTPAVFLGIKSQGEGRSVLRGEQIFPVGD